MEPGLTNGLSDDELADLARLADGTLPADRRAEVEARVAASPQLSSIVERQGVALGALHGTADVGAPARLRAHVERGRGTAGRLGPRRRVVIGQSIAAAAAVALALILVLPSGFSGGPSVADAAALASSRRPSRRPRGAGCPGAPACGGRRRAVPELRREVRLEAGRRPRGRSLRPRRDHRLLREGRAVRSSTRSSPARRSTRRRTRVRPRAPAWSTAASAATAERSSRGSATATRACSPARRCGRQSSSRWPTGAARARSPSSHVLSDAGECAGEEDERVPAR